MKHAIVIFTKVPEPGKVKTRLTEERGGILTPEEAKCFYEACLLDLIDTCTEVDRARIWICHNADGDRDILNLLIAKLKRSDRIAGIFKDQGGTFDECMQYAADFLFKPGQNEKLAESLLILGGDTIGLQVKTLNDAIDYLERINSSPEGKKSAVHLDTCHDDIGAGMVVSADQEGGFNIAGYTCNTPFDFRSVFYNMNGVTALDMLAEKAKERQIPLMPLDIVFDVDLPVDLASIMPILNVLEQGAAIDPRVLAPKRTLAVLRELGLQSYAGPIEGWS